MIRTEDPISGCPPTRAANTDLFVQNFHLDKEAVIHITGSIVRNISGRADLYLYIDGQSKDQIITYTSSAQWETGKTVWAGTLSVGDHTVSLRSPQADVWGCNTQWGTITTLIFE